MHGCSMSQIMRTEKNIWARPKVAFGMLADRNEEVEANNARCRAHQRRPTTCPSGYLPLYLPLL
jgi:hypothetical protein